MTENAKPIDGFVQSAGVVVKSGSSPDCDELAEGFNRAVGPIDAYLKLVAGSPDSVLGELLTSAALSARSAIAACATGDNDVLSDERAGLGNALVLIERRRQELLR